MAQNGDKKDRLDELSGIFEGIDEDVRTVIRPLITETVYLEKELDGLRGLPKIRVHPNDASKQQTTPAAKLYKELLQQYTNCIKVLESVLTKNAPEEESPLRQWLNDRKKQYETR